MARLLSQLLGASEPDFSMIIRQLEAVCGHPSVDVRLASEIVQKRQTAVQGLGFDAHDTTDEELYAALLNQVKQQEDRLLDVLGATRSSTANEVVAAVMREVNGLDIPKQCWALKSTAIKRLFKTLPPKTTMKTLGYKSLDSLIKREPTDVLLAAGLVLESKKWQAAIRHFYKSLQASDFETRKVRLVPLDNKRWQAVAAKFVPQNHHNIMLLREAGLVAVLPLPVKQLPGIALTSLSQILHSYCEIRIYSSFIKMRQMAPEFGDIIASSAQDAARTDIKVAGQAIQWRIIHRYFGLEQNKQPDLFEPYVRDDDLAWRQTEDILAEVLPELTFWRGLDYVGSGDKVPTSLNVMDMAINYCNQLPYGQQSVYYLQQALWSELFQRYLSEQPLKTQLVDTLDSTLNVMQPAELAEEWVNI